MRSRRGDQAAFADRIDRDDALGVNRLLVRITTGGSFPTTIDRVFFSVPVTIDCDEVEGATPTYTDGDLIVPVIALGPLIPSIGDLVVARAVGGRWVIEKGGSTSTCVECEPCCIPARNLVVSWVNSQIGGGSAVLTWDGSTTWSSGCAGPLQMTLACVAGSIVFTVRYFPSGDCPGGSYSECSSASGLTLVQTLCTPFVLTYSMTVASCHDIAIWGYTQFTITQ